MNSARLHCGWKAWKSSQRREDCTKISWLLLSSVYKPQSSCWCREKSYFSKIKVKTERVSLCNLRKFPAKTVDNRKSIPCLPQGRGGSGENKRRDLKRVTILLCSLGTHIPTYWSLLGSFSTASRKVFWVKSKEKQKKLMKIILEIGGGFGIEGIFRMWPGGVSRVRRPLICTFRWSDDRIAFPQTSQFFVEMSHLFFKERRISSRFSENC